MKTIEYLLATSALVAARAMASNYASMAARSLGDNIGAMTNKLHTFDGTVYAPVTDCNIFTSYTPPPPAATGGAQAGTGAGSASSPKVTMKITGFADTRTFDNVPANDTIFIVGSERQGVSVNEMEVVDGPAGVKCKAWRDRQAKVQIGSAVEVGETVDLVHLEEASDIVRSLQCAIA